jgi:hypothetical protein
MIVQTKNTVLPSPKTPTSAKSPKGGLAASKFAAEPESPVTPSAKAEPEAAEGEHDSSSAALASVRQPSPNTPVLSLLVSSPNLTISPNKRNPRTAALTDHIFSFTVSES